MNNEYNIKYLPSVSDDEAREIAIKKLRVKSATDFIAVQF